MQKGSRDPYSSPDIPSHTARCCCSPPAALSRPKELTAVLCMHIYLSFKHTKIFSNSMRTNNLNPDAFTELLHLSDMLGQNCLFSTVTWLLLCFLICSISAITMFGSDSSKPEINCGPKDITPKIVFTKHHHFEAPLTSHSFIPPWSIPLWTWPVLKDLVCRQYTPAQLSSAHHFSYQQPHSLSLFSEKEQQWHWNWYIPQKKHLSEMRPIRF